MDEDEGMNDIFDDDLDNIVENEKDAAYDGSGENVNPPNDDGQDSTQTAKKVEAKKRVVRNPRVTLNPQRLCGERGIVTLPKAFENIKFKGKGHEKEDLDKLMSILKHWCYRLFPSMCFSDVLETIERLGKKKEVQVCLRKIRLDMPISNEDFVRDDSDDDDANRNVFNTGDTSQDAMNDDMHSSGMPGTSRTMLNEDVFDELIKDYEQHVNVPVTHNNENMNIDTSLVNTFPARFPVALSEPIMSLTEEQKERIERNAMLARERRTQSKSLQPVNGHNRNEMDEEAGFSLESSLSVAANSNIVSDVPFEHSFEELPFKNNLGLEVMSSAKESELNEFHHVELPSSSKVFNLSNSHTEISYVEAHAAKSSNYEAMFSSDESNDDIKLNITNDVLLKCGEKSELAESSRGIIE